MYNYKIVYSVIVFVVIIYSGCAKVNPQQKAIEEQGKNFQNQSESRTITVVNEPYLGAKKKPLLSGTAPALQKHVMLRRRGSLASIAKAINELTGLPVQIAPDQDEKKSSPDGGASEAIRGDNHQQAQAPQPGQNQDQKVNLELEALLQGGGKVTSAGLRFDGGKTIAVNYEGTLRGLLDHISTLSGYGWDYDDKNNSVTFAKMLVRTFTILGAPGKVSFENKLTNKSKESNNSSVSSSKINSTVSTADAGNQTAQTNSTALIFDIWADTEHAIKSLLTQKGTVTCNQAAGTVTVRDTPESVRRVATYIDDLNLRLSRQVALTVRVWSLDLKDNTDIGFNMQVLFENTDIKIDSGSVTDIGALNTAAATIVSGKLKGSSATLKALREWGNASQVTSAGGLVMSNQPVPVLAIERHAYLAGVGKSTTDYSQTTDVTPGEVTVGFAMTVIPHILDQRRVILQYNINLSSLDEMKEFTTSDVTIELPQVSTQALSQRSTMKMGQTLVLCGFEKESHTTSSSIGLTKSGHTGDYGRKLLIITIAIESAEA